MSLERVGLAGARAGRPLLEAEHEARAGQDAFERHPDAGLEAALGRALLVERHQRVEIALGHRCAGTPATPGATTISCAHTHLLRRGARGWQVKIFRRLGVSETPVAVERPGDRQVAQVRQRREAVGVGDAGAGERPLERRDQILRRALRSGG